MDQDVGSTRALGGDNRPAVDQEVGHLLPRAVALPFLPAYARLGHQAEDFPASFAMQSRILSLPMFAEISDEQIERVADSVARFCRG